MKNTIYAIIAASLAMLASSGILALATAAPPEAQPMQLVPVVDAQQEAEDFVSEFIDAEYRKILAREQREKR